MLGSRRDFLAATITSLALGRSAIARADDGVSWTLPAKGEVKRVDMVRIPMRDGVRLCGRLWLPADAETRPAPVVLEYIPYRTRDAYSAADDHWGETLARYGIGFARIDIRGSGDSEGLLRDEYLASEQDDAVQIIAWLAGQSWCNGAVGMRGISWGGFSTLQTAMRNPPALKAIMPMACSDRRYTDDAHYVGGCLGLTNFKWGVNFKGVMAGPPDPAIAGPAWERMWRERLEASPPIIARWTEHQHEDCYWRHGSVQVRLQRSEMSHLCGGRLGGCLCPFGAPPPGRTCLSAQGIGRPLGTYLSMARRPRAGARLGVRRGALVVALAPW